MISWPHKKTGFTLQQKHPKKHPTKAQLKRRLIRRHRTAMGFGVLLGFVLIVFSYTVGLYGWYRYVHRGEPYVLGVSFSMGQAQALGVDGHAVYMAALDDLQIKHFRLNSYWKTIEPEKGKFDFTELDWEMNQAAAHGAKVNLAIGLRQPRWPECHPPSWVDTTQPWSVWQPDMNAFLTKVVERYKNHPALDTYQLENEYFNTIFGECKNYDRQRLIDEKALVNKLDPTRPVIISRSDNGGFPTVNQPRGDVNGESLYRTVGSNFFFYHGYFTYPLPKYHYGFEAAQQRFWFGEESTIHELQTEPWPTHGKFITEVSLEEQSKSLDAHQLTTTVAFAKATGIRHIDLWGVEYWYWRANVAKDTSVWDAARTAFRTENTALTPSSTPIAPSWLTLKNSNQAKLK